MKKLGILLAAIILTAVATAQNPISFYFSNQPVNDTIEYQAGRLDDDNIVWVSVKNETSDSLFLTVSKEVISELPGSYNTFCMGSCYDPSVMVAPRTMDLAAGESSSNEQFHMVYNPVGAYGTTIVKFTFTDAAAGVSNSYVIKLVTVNEDEDGISDRPVSLNSFTAYPNPATTQVTFQYDLSNQTAGDATRIVITDLVGNKVRNLPIANAAGKRTLDVSDLVPGIYFYSLVSNGRTLSTKKLIVK